MKIRVKKFGSNINNPEKALLRCAEIDDSEEFVYKTLNFDLENEGLLSEIIPRAKKIIFPKLEKSYYRYQTQLRKQAELYK